MVNGNANMAAQAHPMSKNDPNNKYWSCIKKMEMNPIPPNIKLTT